MNLEFQFVALFLDSVDKLLPFLPSVRHKINWEPERSKVLCDRRSKCQLRLYQISVWHSWLERRRLHPNASLRMGESDASGGGGGKWCACATWLGQVRSFLTSTCCTRRFSSVPTGGMPFGLPWSHRLSGLCDAFIPCPALPRRYRLRRM